MSGYDCTILTCKIHKFVFHNSESFWLLFSRKRLNTSNYQSLLVVDHPDWIHGVLNLKYRIQRWRSSIMKRICNQFRDFECLVIVIRLCFYISESPQAYSNIFSPQAYSNKFWTQNSVCYTNIEANSEINVNIHY